MRILCGKALCRLLMGMGTMRERICACACGGLNARGEGYSSATLMISQGEPGRAIVARRTLPAGVQ